MTAEEIFIKIQPRFPGLAKAGAQVKEYPAWSVGSGSVRKLCEALCSEFSFDYLDMITAVDWSGPVNPGGYPVAPNPSPYTQPPAPASPAPSAAAKDTFEIVYLLTSLSSGIKICLRCEIPRKEPPPVPSLCGVFKTADWHEREIYDLFGISFEGHPNLRRILSPETVTGHPLRKDYVHVPDKFD